MLSLSCDVYTRFHMSLRVRIPETKNKTAICAYPKFPLFHPRLFIALLGCFPPVITHHTLLTLCRFLMMTLYQLLVIFSPILLLVHCVPNPHQGNHNVRGLFPLVILPAGRQQAQPLRLNGTNTASLSPLSLSSLWLSSNVTTSVSAPLNASSLEVRPPICDGVHFGHALRHKSCEGTLSQLQQSLYPSSGDGSRVKSFGVKGRTRWDVVVPRRISSCKWARVMQLVVF